MPPERLHITLVFHDPSYPEACSQEIVARFLPGERRIVNAQNLACCLQSGCDVLVSFHGPYFPKEAWPAILHFLEAGGSLAVFGGMPFTRPIRPDGVIEAEQYAYTEQLCLGPFFALDLPTADLRVRAAKEAVFLKDCVLHLPAERHGTFWSFYPKLTQVSDHPEDMGSAGPFDTLLTPLLFADTETASDTSHLATPVVLLDQQYGRFKGGRWLLSPWRPVEVTTWLELAPVLQQLISLVEEGMTILQIRPQWGCYQPGEAPQIGVSLRTQRDIQMYIHLYNPDGELIATHERQRKGSSVVQEVLIQLPPQLLPGLYRAQVSFESTSALMQCYESGFWVWDQALVEATHTKKLSAGRDYFYQNATIFPLCGTTYMDSRTQRKFLSLPNPARWDSDFAEMKASGINLLRTGIWTDWRSIMPEPGLVNEAALRALDAFVMTACRHEMQLIFTFFSFYPPLFEGENPWLDPRSLEGQQDFVAIIARRYAQVEILAWDLINEPSFGDPQLIFSQRPIPHYDQFEQTAFRNWLAERSTLQELQVRWHQTPATLLTDKDITLPQRADYSTASSDTSGRNMFKVMDYTFFSQEMFKRWAALLYATLREAGSQTLIGVGQDEAGARLSPQFYAPAVDYTTTHPWWNNDDLLWDMLMDKTLEKPNIIQEIGVMLVRDVDMRPFRSEQQSADLLERKCITGLIARGAGLIQWLWHINPYMTSDNENSIGLIRPDGSAKPEMTVMRELGRLMQALTNQLVEPTTVPDVWIIIPYSQWFLRPALAIEATQQAVRVLGYDLGIIPQMVGEHQLVDLAQTRGYQPRTLILPSVQTFSPQAWNAVLTYVDAGATLLVSGVLSRDQYNLIEHFALVDEHGEDLQTTPVSRYEELEFLPGQKQQLLFDKGKMGYVRKMHTPSAVSNQIKVYQHGAGKLIWSGLPLELSANAAVVRTLYQYALNLEVQTIQDKSALLVIKRPLKEGLLILVVSESAVVRHIVASDQLILQVEAGRAGAVMIMNDGQVTAFGGVHL